MRRDGGKGEEVRERGTERKGGKGRSRRTRKGEMKGERKRDLKEVDLQWDVPKVGSSSPRHSGPDLAGKGTVAAGSSFHDS